MEQVFNIQDTCGVHNLHGLPGVFSGIAATIAASVARKIETDDNHIVYGDSLYVVFPARAPEGNNITDCGLTSTEVALGVECGDGRSAPQQAGYQLALLVCTLCIAIIGGLITGIIAGLPTFQAIGKDYLFDDSLYWNLADDADNYLPKNDHEEEPQPSGAVTNSIRLEETELENVACDDKRALTPISPLDLDTRI